MSGSGDDARRFDPRFDPQFQPGYRGGGGGAGGASAARPLPPGVELRPVRTSGDGAPAAYARPSRPDASSAIDSLFFAPASALAPDHAPISDRDGRLLEVDGLVVDADHRSADAPVDAAGVGSPDVVRNPFVVALWVVSAALVVAGFAVIGALRSSAESLETSSSQSQWDYFFLQSFSSAAPLLILLGVATAVALLFFHAAVHERAERERRVRERVQV